MKKYKTNFILGLITIITLIIVSGCTNKNIDPKVVGTWKYTDDGYSVEYVFNGNGTGTYTLTVGEESEKKNITYKNKDGKFLITFEKDTDVFENKYTIKNGNLIIEDSFGEKIKYKKGE